MANRIEINTNLIKKGEVFKIMALAESIGSPVLLIGPPGTGKTATVLDYAKASQGNLKDDDVFILETDEGTSSTAIKGMVDLEKLTTTSKYQVNSPVTKAKFVVINEVDKASAGLRNSLLGVMNEKVLFNGSEKVPCQWKTFVATCNKIPDDEIDSPFWDRFLITFTVDRLRQSDLLDYYKKGGKSASFKYKTNMPTQSELDAIVIPAASLKKVLNLTYGKLSDRSLSFIPELAKHIAGVWGYNANKALVKSVELLISKEDANVLAKSLVPKELRELYDKVDMIEQMPNYEAYTNLLEQLDSMGVKLREKGILTKEDEDDIQRLAEEKSATLEFLIEEDENFEE